MKKKQVASKSKAPHRSPNKQGAPLVGIIMGSLSDWETLSECAETLKLLEIRFETRVVSAHRTPDLLFEYASAAKQRGLKLIIAGAGGAAHLPGMTAAKCALPVLGVPVESKALRGADSLLSIVQMPSGVPVATFAIGKSGAVNAALFAASVLGLNDARIMQALERYRSEQTKRVLECGDPQAHSVSQVPALRASKFSRRRPQGRHSGPKVKKLP